MDKETIEALHNAGKMPDWIYYQVNKRSPIENYIEQKKKIRESTKKYQKKDDDEDDVNINVTSEVRIKK